MSQVNTEWLPHLSTEVLSEIKGSYLDAYVVALEGWRRGLTLKWHVKDSEKFKDMKTWYVDQPGQLFSLHSENKSHYFFRTRGDKVTNSAVENGMNKEKTKQILSRTNVLVPEGRSFTRDAEKEDIAAYASEIGYPVVIKPADGSFGRGVMTNVKTETELTYAIEYLFEEMAEDEIIVEKFISGKDYRLYVVGDQVVGAILRIPPNVTGDGINSISSLIEIKNNERQLNPRLIDCPIKVDKEITDYIGQHGYTLNSVPENGEVIYLNNKCNVSIGGDPVGVLDELSPAVKRTAVKALQAIEGLEHGAVDVIVEETENGAQNSYVIELNPTAQLGGILFPYKGQPSDVPSAIIDYYFPETVGIKTDKEMMYFDFFDVLEPLISRQSVIATVSPSLIGEIHMKKYTVYGDVLDLGYHLGLRKQAFERNLHGFVSISENNESIEIVVAGTDEEMVDDFKNGITEDEERATVIEIQESNYNGYVKVGFDSRANIKTIVEDLELLKSEMNETNYKVRKLEVERRKLLQSTSWRITYPIRVIGAVLKPFKKIKNGVLR